jgi:hypothetical protein
LKTCSEILWERIDDPFYFQGRGGVELWEGSSGCMLLIRREIEFADF